jgi:hypothetical protein
MTNVRQPGEAKTRNGEVSLESEPVDISTLRGFLQRRGRRVSLRAMELAMRHGAVGRLPE